MTLYSIALWVATGMALVSMSGRWVSRRVRVEVTDKGVDFIRRVQQLEAEHERLTGPTKRATFEPFATCPGCSVPGYHLFAAPRELVESRPERVVGARWVEAEDYDGVSFWNTSGTYRVHHRDRGQVVIKKYVSTVVDRECLSCGKTWMETYTA